MAAVLAVDAIGMDLSHDVESKAGDDREMSASSERLGASGRNFRPRIVRSCHTVASNERVLERL